jgi:transposase
MEMRAHDWTPGPNIEWRTAMEDYIGFDVSMKETSVSIRRSGERIWRGKCASDPRIIAELIRKRAPAVKRVVFETGPLSIWFYHSLRTEGLAAICIDARHLKRRSIWRRTRRTRTMLAQLAEVGFFREVRARVCRALPSLVWSHSS